MVFPDDTRPWYQIYQDIDDPSRAAGYHQVPGHVNQAIRERIADQITPHLERYNVDTILDAGAGPGHHARRWQRSGYDVIPLDLCPEPLPTCGVQGSIASLPMRDQAVDATFCSAVLYDLDDDTWARALREIDRVTSRLLVLRIDPQRGKVGRFTFRGIDATSCQLDKWILYDVDTLRDRPILPWTWTVRAGWLMKSPEVLTYWTRS